MTVLARPLCRHCHTGRGLRPRGLCWTCYYQPGVRDRYPMRVNRGSGANLSRPAPLPATPTMAFPGSPEKIAVMRQRAARGEQLFHPLDRR